MGSAGIGPYCWAWDRVYVKSNGRVPCWCDWGEMHTIVHKDPKQIDFVTDIVNGPEMREMRTKILVDQQYYIKDCERCGCMTDEKRGEWYRYQDGSVPNYQITQDNINKALAHMARVQKEHGWPFGSIDIINEIQMEPSYLCGLKCQACTHGGPNAFKRETAPYLMDMDWLKSVLFSLVLHKIKVNHVSFVGRGEPTLSPQFPAMLNIIRKALPDTFMFMDTNCNQPFKDEYFNLTQINCSVDGSDPEKYPLYRVNGKLDLALKFMRDAAKRKKELGAKTIIAWKYILFDTTDDDEQIRNAQRLAKEMGVDRLDFNLTASDGTTVKRSRRFPTIESLDAYLAQQETKFDYLIRRT